MPRVALCTLLLLLAAVSVAAQDVLTLGSREVAAGGVVQVPVSIIDRTGTALGTETGTGNRIQGIAFKVLFPTELVASVTFSRGGVLAAATPLHEAMLQGTGYAAYVVSFSELAHPLAFTPNAPAPGNTIGTLTVTMQPGVTVGTTAALTLDPPSAMLSNQAGTVRETVSAGNLALVNGSVTVNNATPTVFTDDPLVPMVTPVKLAHIMELRAAINAMRASASLPPLGGDTSIGGGLPVRASHITALRTGLDEARAALGLPALVYTDATLSPGTRIKAAHVQELREGTR